MTPIQEFLEDKKENMTLDTFGKIMDEFIEKNDCQMLITLPEGKTEPEVKDNMGLGPVGAFYFILKAITPVLNDLLNMFDGEFDREGLVKELLGLVEKELLGEEE